MSAPETSFDRIFARLQEMAARREAEAHDGAAQMGGDAAGHGAAVGPTGSDPLRLGAGGAHALTGGTYKDEPVCLCDGSPHVHVKSEGRRKTFAVCPACNPRLHCARCGGSGHLRRFNLVTLRDDVTPNGCDCTTLEKRVAVLQQAGIPEKYCEADFSVMELGHLNAEQQLKLTQVQQAVYEFCDATQHMVAHGAQAHEKYFLTLVGPVGTGKTHLAVSALKRMILQYGAQGRFIDFLFLLSQLRDVYARKGSEESILAPLREADVLLIDELGKGRAENEWQLEKLDDLINSRYNSGRVTILTSNYLPPELSYEMGRNGMRNTPVNETFWTQSLPERVGARMYDRILEASYFVDFMGLESFRRSSAQHFLAKYMDAKHRPGGSARG